MLSTWFLWATALASASPNQPLLEERSKPLCPGYRATKVQTSPTGLTAQLTLAGPACKAYSTDLENLTLTVEYQTATRLHVIIQDADSQVYQVPSSFLPRPRADGSLHDAAASEIAFDYVASPFSFTVTRRSNGEVLFDTSAAPLVFESQYLRLRTKLPPKPSLYGLAEHTDPFMLNTTNYTRTLWNRDAYQIPRGTNLYGDHPVYFDHRGSKGTHAVFLLNSNGMDVHIDDSHGQFLEYNVIGGVLDFYFLAGPTPVQVAQQYSLVVGQSAMMPYWGLGFHQCRYGMQDVYEVAEVMANYSSAAIPLETMWTDIDYMYLRRIFSLDPVRFPLHLMRQLVDTIHARDQHYVLMVDPAVAYQDYPPFNDGLAAGAFLKNADGSTYQGVVWPGVTAFPDWFSPTTQAYWDTQFDRFFSASTGVDIDALWIDMNEASNFCNYPCTPAADIAATQGDPPIPPDVRLCSPRSVDGFPADFQPCCQASVDFNVRADTYSGEYIFVFGSAVTIGAGKDVYNAVPLNPGEASAWQGVIDMPANSEITYQYVRLESDGSWIFETTNRTIQTGGCGSQVKTSDTITTAEGHHQARLLRSRTVSGSLPRAVGPRAVAPAPGPGNMSGLPGRDLINPYYQIKNEAGGLSDATISTALIHQNGLAEYDTHNLFGAMMSATSRNAMLSRRPTLRPMIITRSTFAGSGRHVGHWLGDNSATWDDYLISISGLLEFGALYQMPMVGSDVCGYALETNERLCARWASLGAFSPFYRNHGAIDSPPHEFYRWGNDSIVAWSARKAIDIRYRLLDYLYTALWVQNQTGTPAVQPMFFVYPEDEQANALAEQYFFGPSVLVAPVTVENSTWTLAYLPQDVFYDFHTGDRVQGAGAWTNLTGVAYDTIPLFYRGGAIVPQRVGGANTTAALRNLNFELVIAPDADGRAAGSLYLDDGVSLEQPRTSFINFTYAAGSLSMDGSFAYDAGDVVIQSVTVLGAPSGSHSIHVGNQHIPLTGPWQGKVGE